MTTLDSTPARPLSWDAATKALHWSMALLIPLAWVIAIVLEQLPRESRGPLMFFHKSVGVTVLALLVLRLLWRATHTAPAGETTPWEPWAGLAAKAGHALLYILMVAVPVGGIVTSFANGRSVPFFGLFEIASPWATKQPFAGQVAEMHEIFGHLLLVVALAHAVIGILHHVVLKDRTLVKMKPFAKA
ncbi:MAG: cytochrome b/b6 domain-containing protein [Siculibacillus sp.]|nr:cytochrome b/b6 domain-containing protein [Siculibacillus sp.]